jgi:hypothetical protein
MPQTETISAWFITTKNFVGNLNLFGSDAIIPHILSIEAKNGMKLG